MNQSDNKENKRKSETKLEGYCTKEHKDHLITVREVGYKGTGNWASEFETLFTCT